MTERLILAGRVRSAAGILGDAVLSKDGAIVAVGRREDLDRPGLITVDHHDATIVPGLADAHFHPLGYTSSVTGLNVHDARTISDVVAAVAARAGQLRPDAAIIGSRLDGQRLTERRLPTRHDLDSITNPVLLYRVCGHVAVANTAALEASGVGPATPDPVGGHLDRDDEGRATGILRETAISLVADAIGTRTDQLDGLEVLGALSGLRNLGLTRLGAMVAAGVGFCADSRSEVETLVRVAHDLPLEITAFVIAESPTELSEAADKITSADAARLRFGGVKIFADGSFGGHTAAMREPFADVATIGTLRLDDRALPLARRSLALGGGVAIHAIGDRAVAAVLDTMTVLLDEGADPARLRIEHASVLLPHDLDRLARLGVTASMQPAFIRSETTWLEERLGADRLPFIYAHRSVLEAGIPLAGGSDCPVEPPSPLWGMHAARDRAGITPEQELTGAQALGMFTGGVAAALGEPDPLSPGSPTHLTVLDADPVECDAAALPTLGIRAVWIGGEQIDVA